jgi:hypothetical protein
MERVALPPAAAFLRAGELDSGRPDADHMIHWNLQPVAHTGRHRNASAAAGDWSSPASIVRSSMEAEPAHGLLKKG